MNKENLIKIIDDLKEVRTKTKSKVSDEILFDCSIRILNSEQIENNRQGKSFSNKSEKPPLVSPATQSQKNLMNTLKIKYKEDITKKEAQKLISSRIQ